MRIPFWQPRTRDYALDQLSVNDSRAISALHREDFSRPWTDGEFADLLEQPTVFGFVARETGHGQEPPAGFVLARLAAGEGEILTVAVARAHRRQGHRLAADGRGAARTARAARRGAVSRGRRDQRCRRWRSTGGSAFARSASARATTSRPAAPAARLSCGAIFASHSAWSNKGEGMIGWIRLVVALLCAAPAYLVFLPLQVLSMKTGWFDEDLFRGLLHKVNVAPWGSGSTGSAR